MYTYFVSFVLSLSNYPSPNYGNFIFDVAEPISDAAGITSLQQQIGAGLQPSFTPGTQVSVTLLNLVLLKHAPAPTPEAPAEAAAETEETPEAEAA